MRTRITLLGRKRTEFLYGLALLLACVVGLSCVTPCTGGRVARLLRGKANSLLQSGTRFRSHVNSDITGDPVFTAPNGLAFTFAGENDKTFCILTEENLHINALLSGYKYSPYELHTSGHVIPQGLQLRTWMKQLGVLWVDPSTGKAHSLVLVARSTDRTNNGGRGFLQEVQLDGRAVRFGYGSSLRVSGLYLDFTAVLNWTAESSIGGNTLLGNSSNSSNSSNRSALVQEEVFALSIPGLLEATVTLVPALEEFQLEKDSEVHFNLDIWKLHLNDQIHGLLGQFYRTDRETKLRALKFLRQYRKGKMPIDTDQASGQGLLQGAVSDYETSGIVETDCSNSQFMVGLGGGQGNRNERFGLANPSLSSLN